MIVVILPATGGISIYHHICGLDGSHMTSFFIQQKCEHDHGKDGTCSECAAETNADNQCSFDAEHCFEFVEFKSLEENFVSAEFSKLEPVASEVVYISISEKLIQDEPLFDLKENNNRYREFKDPKRILIFKNTKEQDNDYFC